MTTLTEVNSVKILINGEENKAFKDNKMKFDDPFVVVKSDDLEETNIIDNTVNS